MNDPRTITLQLTTRDPEETEALGRAVGAAASVGDVLLLEGELGAGKTAFVRGLARGLGLEPRLVSSPTFTIMNRYATPPSGQGDPSPGDAIALVHVDAYRLHGSDELDTIGWDRIIDDDGVIAIEWPERIAERLAELDERRVVRIRLQHAGETDRRVSAAFPSGWRVRPQLGQVLALAGVRSAAARAPARCPVTGVPVAPDNPHWPFASEHARMADLHKWLSGGYVISRELREEDEA